MCPIKKNPFIIGEVNYGKEVIIEAQRLGVWTIAVDRYEHAPAMKVADRSYVIDMLDPQQVRKIVEIEKPNLIVPESKPLLHQLIKLEDEGFRGVPTARATMLTMDRE